MSTVQCGAPDWQNLVIPSGIRNHLGVVERQEELGDSCPKSTNYFWRQADKQKATVIVYRHLQHPRRFHLEPQTHKAIL